MTMATCVLEPRGATAQHRMFLTLTHSLSIYLSLGISSHPTLNFWLIVVREFDCRSWQDREMGNRWAVHGQARRHQKESVGGFEDSGTHERRNTIRRH